MIQQFKSTTEKLLQKTAEELEKLGGLLQASGKRWKMVEKKRKKETRKIMVIVEHCEQYYFFFQKNSLSWKQKKLGTKRRRNEQNKQLTRNRIQ